jgi:hypothetical protein
LLLCFDDPLRETRAFRTRTPFSLFPQSYS